MVIASIDVMDGKAVQLRQGKEKVLERDDPLALAEEFNRFGEIAVIDLDAALGKGENCRLIKQLCALGECRVGGGIRSIEKAKEMISFGATKVIIGTTAFQNDAINHEFLAALKSAVGQNSIIIAIDALHREIVTRGWRHATGINVFDVIKALDGYCGEYLFTCVEKEGGMKGTDLETIMQLRKLTQNKVTAAGGISTMTEIRQLAALDVDVQLGMALYTGKISLAEAFIECLNWKNNLIPTIAQDTTGQVLMLAYSNRNSLEKTFDTGNVWYFSRSRDKLWMKGETSSHFQKLVKMRADCDRDALLATVSQAGVACHTGNYSCFGHKAFSLDELQQVIVDRLENPPPGSYTAKLKDNALLNEKILEEAHELVEASERDHIIWEAADVLYFMLVKLAKNNIPIGEIINELRRRRKR
ncbi:bifunctional phosphoribosyl-AMP cyclohydrolase/phosphoribosyl-ATP diphosphatase HisIE [candidate division KSB1 bacterium]|nr:bifunctional phosphoribosyl-AMP cyclohydrolase/phosphoribosyl-ATP diphosphatase HisIE [candidate division KSB1 bacterium]